MTRAPKLTSNMLQLLPTTMYETSKSRKLQVCETLMLTMCFLKCSHVDIYKLMFIYYKHL